MIKQKYLNWLFWICFAGIALFLSLNKHSKSGYYNYHSEIWADKSGYYVYLPAALKFNFNPHNFPDSIDIKTGNSFQLDYKKGKVFTKYTYGVALLQLPFFLVADVCSNLFNFESNGYSELYHKSINFAAVFYLIIGLILLSKYLKPRFGRRITFLTLASIFLGTNLFFFSIDETGMSHVYSFFLFSAFLYFLQRTNYLKSNKISEAIILGIIGGLIVIVRPTNAIFLFSFFFLDIKNKEEILIRLKRIFRLKTFLPFFLSFFIIILPQLFYWKYLSGSLFYYSYSHEGFDWGNPKILQVWFSPDNGLFLYSPLYLLIILSLIYMIKNRINNVIFILIMFLLLTYIFSCWWDWSFGCSLGARNYIEYLTLLSIPLAFLFQKSIQFNRYKSSIFYILIILIIIYNLKMTYSFDECFQGEGDWDWNAYYRVAVKSYEIDFFKERISMIHIQFIFGKLFFFSHYKYEIL